jgi:hypothetical protein
MGVSLQRGTVRRSVIQHACHMLPQIRVPLEQPAQVRLYIFLRGAGFPDFFRSFLRFSRASRWVAFLGNGWRRIQGRRLSGFLAAVRRGTVVSTLFWPCRLRPGVHLGFLRSGRRQLGQIDDLHGRANKVMWRIVDHRRF